MCILYTQLIPNADHTTGHATVEVPLTTAFNIGTRYSLMMVYFLPKHTQLCPYCVYATDVVHFVGIINKHIVPRSTE